MLVSSLEGDHALLPGEDEEAESREEERSLLLGAVAKEESYAVKGLPLTDTNPRGSTRRCNSDRPARAFRIRMYRWKAAASAGVAEQPDESIEEEAVVVTGGLAKCKGLFENTPFVVSVGEPTPEPHGRLRRDGIRCDEAEWHLDTRR